MPAAPPVSTGPCPSSDALGRGARIGVLVTLAIASWRSSSSSCSTSTGTPLFVVSARGDPGSRLGRGLSTERLGRAHRTAGRRHPQRDVRQHRGADHRVLRAPGRPDRRSSRRRSPARSSATCCWCWAPACCVGGLRNGTQPFSGQDRGHERGAAGAGRSSGCSCRPCSRFTIGATRRRARSTEESVARRDRR